MFDSLKDKFIRLANRTHQWLFGSAMGENTLNFLKNFSYSGLGNIFSSFFLFVAGVTAARLLGPEEFGKYNLVISVASYFYILMLFGTHFSLMKFLPERRQDSESAKKIIASAFWVVSIVSALMLGLFLSAGKILLPLLGISGVIFAYAIIYALLQVPRNIYVGIFRGLQQFRKFAAAEIAYAIVILGSFIILLFFSSYRGFEIYFWAAAIGLIFYLAHFLFRYGRSLKLSLIDKGWSKTLLQYGFYSMIGGFAWALFLTNDKIIINKYINVRDVGIYVAYSSASLVIVGRLLSIFTNVFFSFAAGYQDKQILRNKLNRLIKIGALPAVALNCLLIYFVLFFYGKDYPSRFVWVALFSINAVLYSIVNAKWSLLVSESAAKAKKFGLIFLGIAAINLIFNLILVPRFGIGGAIVSSILALLLFMAVIAGLEHKRASAAAV